MARAIDTTRTVTFPKDPWGTDGPEGSRGFFIAIHDPVVELNEGNGWDIWPCGPFASREAAHDFYVSSLEDDQ